MVREIILAGRKPGCSQHAPSKSSDRWEGGCEGPPSDSSVYWRARQHPSRVPESQQADSRDVLITLPINNRAFQQFPDLHTALQPAPAMQGHRGTASPALHRIPSSLGWCYTSTWALSPRHCLPDIYFAPVHWVGNYSQQPWSEYIWTWGGTGRGGAPKCHRDKLPSHFTCGLMHTLPCLISTFISTIHILLGCYNQSMVHITHHKEI